MNRTALTILSCFFLACTLNAQEVEVNVSEATPAPQAKPLTLDDGLDSPSDVGEFIKPEATPTEDNAAVEEVSSEATQSVESDNAQAAIDELDAETGEATDGDESGELGEDLDQDEVDENAPVFVTLNAQGELIGQATAIVGGESVPIEANVSLVRNGVLLSKIVANEDGSFSFPSIAPGDYNMYGSASSYCGRQTFTVRQVDTCNTCVESLPLRLSQYSEGGCYSGFSSAPAASFSSGSVGGFAGGGGGGFFGGGGFAAGGGGAVAGRSALRLLGLGGIITAIAVGDSDDLLASPSE